jgi:molybdate transport system substrate-binding protein
MAILMRVVLAFAVMVIALTVGCGNGGGDDAILVLAAASLTDTLLEAGVVFEEDSGVEVEFSFGGSNALARQVELGAPSDAVIFAGAAPMDRLEASDQVLAGSRLELLRNRLVVIGDGGAAQLSDLSDLASLGGRIAIADPELAPAGLYAKQAFEAAGSWEGVESRVIPTLDVRAAVGAVDTGSAAFGLVYGTDAAVASGVEVLYVIPEGLHDPIIYPAAIIDREGGSEVARRFIGFLAGDAGGVVFERHGFVPVSR